MINRIKRHPILSTLIEHTCCENDICVSFADDIIEENTVILKVDKFYNSLNIEARPASIDCLIIRNCIGGGLGLTLVELKNISSGQSFDFENMKEKFSNTINDFIQQRFRDVLNVYYDDVKLYFVTNIDIYKRDLGLKMELLMNVQYSFNNRKYMIRPQMPHPTIKNCYSQ